MGARKTQTFTNPTTFGIAQTKPYQRIPRRWSWCDRGAWL